MSFRILSHPESKHNARLPMFRRAWSEQEEPHVGGLSVGIGCSAGLPCYFACFLERKCERPPFLFFWFHLPDLVAQGIHTGDDPSPERRCCASSTAIQWDLQEFNHRSGHGRMDEPFVRRPVFALYVTILTNTPVSYTHLTLPTNRAM